MDLGVQGEPDRQTPRLDPAWASPFQLSSLPAASSTRARGQLPARALHTRAGPGGRSGRPASFSPIPWGPPDLQPALRVRWARSWVRIWGGGEGFLCLASSPPPQARSLGDRLQGDRAGSTPCSPTSRPEHRYSLQWAKTGRTCPMAPFGPASGPPPTPATPPAWAWGQRRSSPPRPRRQRRRHRRRPPPPGRPRSCAAAAAAALSSAPLGRGGRGRARRRITAARAGGGATAGGTNH